MKTCMALLHHLVILIIIIPVVKSEYLVDKCQTTDNYTDNSTYRSNLITLQSYLLATISSGYSIDVTGHYPNLVFGLVLCRGDVSAEICQSCLNSTINEASNRCPSGKEEIIWFDQCFLHYSSYNFFSTVGQVLYGLCDKNDVTTTNPSQYNTIVGELMNTLITQAIHQSNQMFAADFISDTSSSTKVFGQVQCTRDLSKNDCYMCLKEFVTEIPKYCYGKFGGRLLGTSCSIRYESYKFYNDKDVIPEPSISNKGNSAKRIAILVGGPVVTALVIFVAICAYLGWARKKYKPDNNEDSIGRNDGSLMFDISTIISATNNFSEENKLGEGGFGPVYKGIVSNGQEIAVKRLSRNSQQGIEQLRNEVVLLAKLQHKNLVKLFGFCLAGSEKLLVFEYLCNTSLDNFLFDPVKRPELDWQTRLNLIEGVGRGLLYLHEDSRLKIIHRDLKASNILLDEDMNPKISDFGLAKLFHLEDNATHANTSRIAGTYGYMAPEYAMQGQFSTKSDVYSYGILVLEILTGRTSNFIPDKMDEGLLSYVWRHWKQGEPLEAIDKSVTGNCPSQELIRCLHIGLLCIQEDPSERPNMASVIHMLRNQSNTTAAPSPPMVFFQSLNRTAGQTSLTEDNGMTMSENAESTTTKKSENISLLSM